MLAGAQWDMLCTCRAPLSRKRPSSRGSAQAWSRQSIWSNWPAGRGAWTHTLWSQSMMRRNNYYIQNKLNTKMSLDNRGWHALPGWRVHTKVFLIDWIEWNKVCHWLHVQMNKDDILQLPAFAVQLTCARTTHHTINKEISQIQPHILAETSWPNLVKLDISIYCKQNPNLLCLLTHTWRFVTKQEWNSPSKCL